jgi:hypothetical protein
MVHISYLYILTVILSIHCHEGKHNLLYPHFPMMVRTSSLMPSCSRMCTPTPTIQWTKG